MTDTYRIGDIARLYGEPAVLIRQDHEEAPGPVTEWVTIETGYQYDVATNPPVGPILGNVADIAELRGILAEVDLAHLPVQLEEAHAEVASLARWKEEAMPVMDGLQELGKALRIPLGQRITGPAALEAVQQLRDAAQAFLDAYDAVGIEVWWPDEVEPLREVLER